MADTAVRATLIRAIEKLQRTHLKALTEGEGRGLSTERMTELWDQETGYSDLYDALAYLVQSGAIGGYDHLTDGCKNCKIRRLLKRIRGEHTQSPSGNYGGDGL